MKISRSAVVPLILTLKYQWDLANVCFPYPYIHAAKLPRITSHPEQLKDAVPGETLAFTIQASGTEPLNYHWEIRDESGGWQFCDVEKFPGAKGPTLTIPIVQKSDEGSYRCTVSNCAGRKTSQCVPLTVGKNCYKKTIQFLCTLKC